MNNKRLSRITAIACASTLVFASGSVFDIKSAEAEYQTRYMEYLNRGVVAVMSDAGVFVSWRLLATDNDNQLFDVYRSVNGGASQKLATPAITTGTNYVDTEVTRSNWSADKTYTYYVVPKDQTVNTSDTSCSFVLPASTTSRYSESSLNSINDITGYTIPLKAGDGNTPQNGREIRNVWVGDFDGDGAYDFALTRVGDAAATATESGEPTAEVEEKSEDQTEKDSIGTKSQALEVYKSDGTLLWTMDYGKNSLDLTRTHPGSAVIGVGQADGIEVYDLNMDGYAEVISQLANYTTLPDGTVWREGADDYTQYVGVFDGMTGDLMTYAEIPKDYYGDGAQGAFLTGIAYLDGKTPSLICNWKNRGTDGNFHELILAYKMYGSELKLQWKFDRGAESWQDEGYALDDYPGGQKDGHQLRIADVDNDGKDEILQISFAVDDDGTLLYQLDDGGKWTCDKGVWTYSGDWYIKHGDRFYVCKMDKDDEHMMGYGVQQRNPANILEYFYDAKTGKVLWTRPHGSESLDIGRGDVGDIDPASPGWEFWSFYGVCNPTVTINGEKETASIEQLTGEEGKTEVRKDPYPAIGVWFDGDLGRENMIDTVVNQWVPDSGVSARVKSLYRSGWGAVRNNRKAPLFVGDMIGDWREEIIMTNAAYDALVVYTSGIKTDHRLYCLAQDPLYRNCMALKGYTESHQVSYYLGFDMDKDSNNQPLIRNVKPNISIIEKREPVTKTLKVSNVKKLYYRTGEMFDNTMTVKYNDSVISSGYVVSGFDSSKTGRQTIQVTYNGCMDSFDVLVCDSSGTIKSEDFEGETHTAGYAKRGSHSSNTCVWEKETKLNDANDPDLTKIYGINKAKDGAWWIAPHDIMDKSKIEFDFKIDAGSNNQTAGVYLLGYTKENADFLSNDDKAGRGKIIAQLTATPTSNGVFGDKSIQLNGADITDKAKVDIGNDWKKTQASSLSNLNRDSTGWLHMKADFDFGIRRADITITRISDGSPVYCGSVNIGSTITEFREIYLNIGNDSYGGVYIDNIAAKIDTKLFDKCFSGKDDMASVDITKAADFEYTNDRTKDYPDAHGFCTEAESVEPGQRIYWYLSKDGGKNYTYLTRTGEIGSISGPALFGLVIYSLPDNLTGKTVTAGYTIE